MADCEFIENHQSPSITINHKNIYTKTTGNVWLAFTDYRYFLTCAKIELQG
jgi:hypothetical protein